MSETPEDLYERARGPLRMPAVEEWTTCLFEGELRPCELLPPVAEEPPRTREGGLVCWRRAAGDADAIWSDERWVLSPLREPSGDARRRDPVGAAPTTTWGSPR